MSNAQRITVVTRRDLFDHMSLERLHWSGRLDEPDFCARVWPDTKKMRSNDPRFPNVYADIYQHRVNNYDWEDDWIFTDDRFDLLNCPDEKFLEFLAQVVHPVVRPDADSAKELVEEFNRRLRIDGFVLRQAAVTSNRPVYAGAPLRASHTPSTALNLPTRALLDDHSALQDHLKAIEDTVDKDPAAAITSAKDLVETTYKLILDNRGVAYGRRDDLPSLYKKVAVELKLDKESVPSSAPASEAAHKVLNSLTASVHGLAEMRNQLGRGHGRTAPSPALERHARLAFNAAVALTEFLFDTWQPRDA
jgi:hypothetical protein